MPRRQATDEIKVKQRQPLHSKLIVMSQVVKRKEKKHFDHQKKKARWSQESTFMMEEI